MNTTQNLAGTSGLLDIFKNIKVRKDETITDADRQHCERQQTELYRTLDQIEKWYNIFRQEGEQHTSTLNVRYAGDGSVNYNNPVLNRHNSTDPDYRLLQFYPFEDINKLVKSYKQAVINFGRAIVDYFNRTYNIAVPDPKVDEKRLPIGNRPTYQTYVDQVIGHLGGQGFRNVAEQEIIGRIHKLLRPYSHRTDPRYELKGATICIYDIIVWNSFDLQYNRCDIHYDYRDYLAIICEGIAFGACGKLNGKTSDIGGLNDRDVDLTLWHDLPWSPATGMRFYKNGRLDIRFTDKYQAEKCFVKLGLDKLAAKSDDE